MTYTATKAALNAYISRLSVQYRKDGVIFRSICPGLVDVGATRDPPGEYVRGRRSELRYLSH